MAKNLIRQAVLMVVVVSVVAATAQESKVALPMVAGAAVPLYPPLARTARVEGVVHVKVTTDGHRVIDAHVEDGHKILATAAVDNARTWQFATHRPTTFTVTYYYKLDAKLEEPNQTVVLRFPTEVEISTPLPQLNSSASQ
jgi:hypothetical protein